MLTTIYLIRHAEAEGNLYRRCQGHYNSLLTPFGVKQTEFLAGRFAGLPLDAIYASDLYRAFTTAKAIADRKGMQVITLPQLREIDMGQWEDKCWAELPVFYPNDALLWMTEPWRCRPPEGETIMDAGRRCFSALKKIAAEHPNGAAAVVSHGSAIRGALCLALKLPEDKMMDVGWGDNTCVAKLLFDGDSVTVEYQNDASHLPDEYSTFHRLSWSNSKEAPSSAQIWFRPIDFDTEADTALNYVEDIYQIAYGSAHLLDKEHMLMRMRRMAAIDKRAVCFGVLGIDEPCALICLDMMDDQQPDTGAIAALCVSEKYRGFGFAAQLLGHATSVYRSWGKDYLSIKPAAHNLRAQAFYRKEGFLEEGQFSNERGQHLVFRKRIKVD